MSTNAYVRWQKHIRDMAAPLPSRGANYHTVYLEFRDPFIGSIENFVKFVFTSMGSTQNPIISLESHELQILEFTQEYLRHVAGNGEPLPSQLFTFAYISETHFESVVSSLKHVCKLIHVGPAFELGKTSKPDPNFLGFTIPDNTTPAAPIFAIIDDGIGFLNDRFNRLTGDSSRKTRFKGVWLQAREKVSVDKSSALNTGSSIESGIETVGAGWTFDDKDIDAMLKFSNESDQYARINDAVFPEESHRSVSFAFSHGTHVADLACGTDACEQSPMSDVDLLAVQLPPGSIRETKGKLLHINVLQAVRWILYNAINVSNNRNSGGTFERRPLIINISLGVTAGAKDGSGFIEEYLINELDLFQYLSNDTPVHVVLAFGNDYSSRQIALRDTADRSEPLLWRLQPDDRNANYLEIRPLKNRPVKIGIKPPGSTREDVMLPKPGSSHDIRVKGKTVARVYHEMPGLQGAEPALILTTLPTAAENSDVAPAGAWEITFESPNDSDNQLVSLQIQRGDTPVGYRIHGRQSYFDHIDAHEYCAVERAYSDTDNSPLERQASHSALASAADQRISKVGSVYKRSYNVSCGWEPSWYSAAGSDNPDLSNVIRPEFSAVGDSSSISPGVLGSGTLSNTSFRLSGTSVSAPQVCRYWLLHYLDENPAIENTNSADNRLGTQFVPQSVRYP